MSTDALEALKALQAILQREVDRLIAAGAGKARLTDSQLRDGCGRAAVNSVMAQSWFDAGARFAEQHHLGPAPPASPGLQ